MELTEQILSYIEDHTQEAFDLLVQPEPALDLLPEYTGALAVDYGYRLKMEAECIVYIPLDLHNSLVCRLSANVDGTCHRLSRGSAGDVLELLLLFLKPCVYKPQIVQLDSQLHNTRLQAHIIALGGFQYGGLCAGGHYLHLVADNQRSWQRLGAANGLGYVQFALSLVELTAHGGACGGQIGILALFLPAL